MEHKKNISAATKPQPFMGGLHTNEVLRRHKVLFPTIVVIAIASPFLGLFVSGWLGVILGLLISITALLLGFKAVTAVIRETYFRAQRAATIAR